MRNKIPLFLLLVTTAWISAVCVGPSGPGNEETWEKEIPRLMELAEVPGLSIAVIRGGRLFWSGAFGVRSRETGVPVDTDTMFEAASLSKTITAACALKLVERGLLDLDRPLCEYLPYPKLAGDERYKKITARLVLTHTTGLPNWGTRLIREPGTLYGYSGEGFLYLGRTVAEISGKELDAFARETIFEPLGMTRTGYVWSETYAANGACGHDRNGKAYPLRKRTEPNGGASLVTTATDYARFLCAVLNDEILAPETVRDMIAPQVRATVRRGTELDEHISWGWGWGVQPASQGTGFWHWGDNGILRGFTSAYNYNKEGFVFFANSANTFALAQPLAELLTPETQWAMSWLHFEEERYDNPQRAARRAVEKAFYEQGSEAGLRSLEETRARFPGRFGVKEMTETAMSLFEQEKRDEAAALLRRTLGLDPGRADAWTVLGIVELERLEFSQAASSFENALKIDADLIAAKNGIEWIRDLERVRAHPVEISPQILRSYAGEYGPRRITLREGSLFYQRESGPEYRMFPLSRDTFYLDGNLRFRLRFKPGESGPAAAIIGLYIEGRRDSNQRTG